MKKFNFDWKDICIVPRKKEKLMNNYFETQDWQRKFVGQTWVDGNGEAGFGKDCKVVSTRYVSGL